MNGTPQTQCLTWTWEPPEMVLLTGSQGKQKPASQEAALFLKGGGLRELIFYLFFPHNGVLIPKNPVRISLSRHFVFMLSHIYGSLLFRVGATPALTPRLRRPPAHSAQEPSQLPFPPNATDF